MAVSVSIKKTRDPRGKYVFSASQYKGATKETNVRVQRVAEEIAKYLAGQMAEQDNPEK